MFTLKIELNEYDILNLSGNEKDYQIVKIDGLNPPKADVFYSPMANMAGGRYKASKVQVRNVVITIRINGEVESNRLRLYKYFRSGKWCKIHYTNDSRDVYIEGYVETIENDLFTMSETCQISIICPRPYWRNTEIIVSDIVRVIGGFTFPFSISSEGIEFSRISKDENVIVNNSGEVECGTIIRIITHSAMNNLMVTHENLQNTFFGISGTLNAEDEVIINTNKGEKSITINGENALNRVVKDSTWFSMLNGANVFSYSVSSGNLDDLEMTFEINELFAGV